MLRSTYKQDFSPQSETRFTFIYIGGVTLEWVLLAIWHRHGAHLTGVHQYIFYGLAALLVIYILYRMFVVQRISLPNLADLLTEASTSSSGEGKVYYGWQAMLAGLFWLGGALIVPFIVWNL